MLKSQAKEDELSAYDRQTFKFLFLYYLLMTRDDISDYHDVETNLMIMTEMIHNDCYFFGHFKIPD